MRTWRPEPCSVSVALDIPCLVKCKVLLTTLDAWKYVGAPVSECLQPEENGVLIFILKIHLPFFNLSKSMEGALCLWLPFLSNKVAKALSRRSKHKHVGELTSVYGEAWACWWWYIHIVSIVLYIIYIYIYGYNYIHIARVHSTIILRMLQGFVVYLFLHGSSYFQSIWSWLRMRTSAAAFYLPVKAAVQGCVGIARLLSVFITPLRYKAWSLCLIHLHVTLHQFWFVPGPCWENVRVSPAKWGKKQMACLLFFLFLPILWWYRLCRWLAKCWQKKGKNSRSKCTVGLKGKTGLSLMLWPVWQMPVPYHFHSPSPNHYAVLVLCFLLTTLQ